MVKWDSADIRVIAFFNKFSAKTHVDVQIKYVPDRDLLYFAILTFPFSKYQKRFIEIVFNSEVEDRRHYPSDFRDCAAIPVVFFKGYFHDVGYPCTESIRLGNPHDSSYGYSYRTPAMQDLKIQDAFNMGSIPCPICYEDELRFMKDQIETESK